MFRLILWTVFLVTLSINLIACQEETMPPDADTPSVAPPHVLVLMPEAYAIGGGTVMNRLIQEAGGINAAADLEDFRQIADSQIIERQPDIILFSQSWTEEQITQWSSADIYAELPAIQNGHLYRLDFSLAEADLLDHEAERIAALQLIFENALQK